MKMKSTMAASSILLFLLVTAHGNTILLPSGDVGGGETDGKPWECCDNYVMSPLRIFPPLYRCEDVVKQCAVGCKDCKQLVPDEDVYVCNDWYQTADPGPFCTPRPWGDCCDDAICNRARIPTCRCVDEMQQCATACNECEMVESSSEPPRYVCKDQFKGQPGPRCTTPDTTN